MDKLIIAPTTSTPDVYFSVDENLFWITGNSRPENARAVYIPINEWIKELVDSIIAGKISTFNNANPLKFKIDLHYFNSSSAKFLYDICVELRRLPDEGVPVNLEWYYEKDDPDMLEAGNDISTMVDMKFSFIQKEE